MWEKRETAECIFPSSLPKRGKAEVFFFQRLDSSRSVFLKLSVVNDLLKKSSSTVGQQLKKKKKRITRKGKLKSPRDIQNIIPGFYIIWFDKCNTGLLHCYAVCVPSRCSQIGLFKTLRAVTHQPGSFVCGDLQARILERLSYPPSGIQGLLHWWAGFFLTTSVTWEASKCSLSFSINILTSLDDNNINSL